MIRFILAGLLVGSSFSVMVASVTNKLTIEGMTMGLASILLIAVLSGVVYLLTGKRKAVVSIS